MVGWRTTDPRTSGRRSGTAICGTVARKELVNYKHTTYPQSIPDADPFRKVLEEDIPGASTQCSLQKHRLIRLALPHLRLDVRLDSSNRNTS